MHFHAYDGKLVSGLALKDACFSVPLSHRGSAHGMWQETGFSFLGPYIMYFPRKPNTYTKPFTVVAPYQHGEIEAQMS